MNDEHFYDAEIHRLMGEAIFVSSQKNNKKGELLLWRAVDTARRQNCKIFELRALSSLVYHAGKKETINLLRDTCKWFNEGKDSYDLTRALDLLRLKH